MDAKPKKFTFLLLPGYAMLSYVSAIEILRQVNRVTGLQVVEWETVSLDGSAVEASNGIAMPVDRAMEDTSGHVQWLCVCSGFYPTDWVTPRLLNYLNRVDRFGATVGGACSGTYILACAGLLNGSPVTIHWEHIEGVREQFPDINVIMDLYTVAPRRFTCAGGAAMLDLMLHYIQDVAGSQIANEVRGQLIINRSQEDRQYYQRSAIAARYGAIHPQIAAVLELIESNLEEPLTRSELARASGLSLRHMERIFRRAFNMGPGRYYLEMRLRKARYLLHHTPMRMAEIAIACGFSSSSHFSKKFKDLYGVSPVAMRGQIHFSGLVKNVA